MASHGSNKTTPSERTVFEDLGYTKCHMAGPFGITQVTERATKLPGFLIHHLLKTISELVSQNMLNLRG